MSTCKKALDEAKIKANEILEIGITNQRETTLLWDKVTGEPVYNAIVWQDRRTSKFCDELRIAGEEKLITRVTGLLLDPYFSATKLKWLLDNVEGVRAKAEAGELLFGTVDTYLIWHLTNGLIHATDATNASRTMLYDINKGEILIDEKNIQMLAKTKLINVFEGAKVEKGEIISEGELDPPDILRYRGITQLAEHIVKEVQDVYRLPGVAINDKHIEVILRQMLKKVEVKDP